MVAAVHCEIVELLVDSQPRSAAMNMALDEVLLREARRPLLRVYGWVRPAVSYGYFEPWEPVAVAHPGRERVRRWTGGGVVLHGEDWTYSFIIPRCDGLAAARPPEIYGWVHRALARVLREWDEADYGEEVTVTTETAEKASQACFENPVAHDVMIGGRKIAGAAQRRSRFGLLHQGSLQGVSVPEDLAGRLAYALGRECVPGIVNGEMLEQAEGLANGKYATEAWCNRV